MEYVLDDTAACLMVAWRLVEHNDGEMVPIVDVLVFMVGQCEECEWKMQE